MLISSILMFLAYVNISSATVGVPIETTQGITMTLSKPTSPVKRQDHLVLSLTLTNATKKVLELDTLTTFSSYDISVHGQDGRVPLETERGCKMHSLSACNEDLRVFNGRFIKTFVQAGQTLSIPIDVSEEYQLSSGIYEIQVVQKGFRLIDAPKDADLLTPNKYKSMKIGIIKSNSISVEIYP